MNAGQASVMTVLGLVPADSIEQTLMHEHVHCDLSPLIEVHGYSSASQTAFEGDICAEARWNPGVHPSNYVMTDESLITSELGYLAGTGFNCVVDVTPADLGRNPHALERISRATGLHIVMGAGWYLEVTHKRFLEGKTVEQVADGIITECRDGVAESGIRPGIIGEVGTNIPITQSEQKSLVGAATAALVTGRSLSVHLHPWGKEGLAALTHIARSGLSADRVILGHVTTSASDESYLRSMMDAGATIAFDLFGFDHSLIGEGRYAPSDWDVCQAIAKLVRDGYGDRIVISQDVGVRTRLHRYGGWGYDHIAQHISPLLLRLGVEPSELAQILIHNTRRHLTLASAAEAAREGL
jgi:phosphotriesterase-related protein